MLVSFQVVCDETNNPPSVIDMNHLFVDITLYFTPDKTNPYLYQLGPNGLKAG